MEGYSNNPNREEARIMAHAEKFAQRKAGSGVVRAPQPRHEEPTPVHHGRNVRIVWVDRDTGAAKDTCVTMLTRLGRIPAEFLKANWGVTNLYWKDTELLVHVMDDGFSATGVPATTSHVHLYADNNPALAPTRVARPEQPFIQPVLVEEVALPLPVRAPSAESQAQVHAPQPAKNFCGNCGARSTGGRFCSECGQQL